MSRALIVLLVLAALTAPSFAQSIARGRRGSAQSKTKNKGKSGSCKVGSTVTTGVAGNYPGSTNHAFSTDQAKAFVENQPAPNVLDHQKTTFDCVDSREPSTDGTNDHLGTPGGDFAELATGIYTYCQQTGTECNRALISRAFGYFMEKVATPSRPFYLHQGEDKINKVLNSIYGEEDPRRPPSLPVVAPKDEALFEKYLQELTVGEYQGCGHVRLMIDEFADYGLDSAVVPVELMRAFFEYWWPTPVGSKQRAKIEFPILQGMLEGDAILIVSAVADSGTCARKSPSVTHAWYGGQAFVYNAAAVSDFRKVTLTDFFKAFAKKERATLDAAAFYTALEALQGVQLGATLKLLGTAKDCPLITVKF